MAGRNGGPKVDMVGSRGSSIASDVVGKDDLAPPWPALASELTEDDLRMVAYEILLVTGGGCSGGGSCVAVPTSAAPDGAAKAKKKTSMSAANSKIRKVFGLKKKTKAKSTDVSTTGNGGARESRGGVEAARPAIFDVLKRQVEISDAMDSCLRKVLGRISRNQAERSQDGVIIPLELVLSVSPSDFSSGREYVRFMRRQLLLLQEGMLNSPAVPGSEDALSLGLRKSLAEISEELDEHGVVERESESMENLRSTVLAKSQRLGPDDNNEDVCHWADGYPLNMCIYEAMLKLVFDSLEESVLVSEAEEILDVLRTAWGLLGLSAVVHAAAFVWVLVRQFVATGGQETDLLVSAIEQLKALASDAKESTEVGMKAWALKGDAKRVRELLGGVEAWAGRQLVDYRGLFREGGGEMMAVLKVALLSDEVLQNEDIRGDTQDSDGAATGLEARQAHISRKVEGYIRMSLRSAFKRVLEEESRQQNAGKGAVLANLAKGVQKVLREEVESYSSTFVASHPNPAGVAAVTLHSCFRLEIKQYMTHVTALNSEVVQLLREANALEKTVVKTVVGEAAKSADGGKGLIREIVPYDTDKVAVGLVTKWVASQVHRLDEWARRTLQMEILYTGKLKSRDRPLGSASATAKGRMDALLPAAPPLTRYKKDVFEKKGIKPSVLGLGPMLGMSEGDVNATSMRRRVSESLAQQLSSLTLATMCVRINTLDYLLNELNTIEKSIISGWRKHLMEISDDGEHGQHEGETPNELRDMFISSRQALRKAIQALCDFSACKIVFIDLREIFIEGLYEGGVDGGKGMALLSDELNVQLGTMVPLIGSEDIKNQAVLSLLKAAMDGFLLVILAGGPARAFKREDARVLEDDFERLKELFIADGEGLPRMEVERTGMGVSQILRLFDMDAPELIKLVDAGDGAGSMDAPSFRTSTSSILASPKSTLFGFRRPKTLSTGDARFTTSPVRGPAERKEKLAGHFLPWLTITNPSDSGLALRVLCYRADRNASKYLKKKFHLPRTMKQSSQTAEG
ncbi:hypothetical protein CBR_g5715 [Chara braunii]|uniref:MHD2 domain-containing protein n=1 Tax=Chara braunii TaxID=69332 RepID=A0A388KJD5_CHABU|nr:hypothetical protein CBR_g5715 [Chara braunii]|eukprot:GBG70083.1 hypothetical protein CBR_g5715 [Chara braunii]